MSKAIVLLSGGIDSAVCLFKAVQDQGARNVVPLTFDWGHRSWREERKASEALARAVGVEPPVIVAIRFPYGGLLTDEEASVPLDRSKHDIEGRGIAPTFFPGRNIVMLSHAFGLAASRGADTIYFGPNSVDEHGYPDCRKAFVSAMEAAGNIGLAVEGIELVAPLIEMSQADIVVMGEGLGVPWGLTFSCYAPAAGKPCGRCDSCSIRREAFKDAGLADPAAA